jgi:hypothetical protein
LPLGIAISETTKATRHHPRHDVENGLRREREVELHSLEQLLRPLTSLLFEGLETAVRTRAMIATGMQISVDDPPRTRLREREVLLQL